MALSSTALPGNSCHSITDVREREDIVGESEYARLIDTANAPIFGIDANGLVNVWNQKLSQVTGFMKEDVTGRNLVREFIASDYQESVQQVCLVPAAADTMTNSAACLGC